MGKSNRWLYVSRKVGRWIIRGGVPEWGPDGPGTIVVSWPWAECSECKERAIETEHGAALTPFCPWCGARMELPEEAGADHGLS